MRKLFGAMFISAFTSLSALGADFTPGNLAIYHIGDGAASLASTGNVVKIDEYTPTGTFVQTFTLPSSGAGNHLVAGGTATAEGNMNRSTNGLYLTFAGYNAPSIPNATALSGSTYDRIVGIMDRTGGVDLTTSLSNWETTPSAGAPRGAVSDDGTNLWITGQNNGVYYTTKGSTTVGPQVVGGTGRRIAIFGDQLYQSTSAATAGVKTIGTGLPKTASQTATTIAASSSPYDFFICDLSSSVAGLDTMYVLDDGTGFCTKYSLVGGTWAATGTFTAGTSTRGMTGQVNGTTVKLFMSASAGSSTSQGSLSTATDSTGYNQTMTATPSTILTGSGSKNVLRGITFAPAPQAQLSATAAAGASLGAVAEETTLDIAGAGANNGHVTVVSTVPTVTLALDIERGDGGSPADFATQIGTLVSHLQTNAATSNYVVTNLIANPGSLPSSAPDSDFEVLLTFNSVNPLTQTNFNFDFFNDTGLDIDRVYAAPEPTTAALVLLGGFGLLRRTRRQIA